MRGNGGGKEGGREVRESVCLRSCDFHCGGVLAFFLFWNQRYISVVEKTMIDDECR